MSKKRFEFICLSDWQLQKLLEPFLEQGETIRSLGWDDLSREEVKNMLEVLHILPYILFYD
ncbi:MAG: hypothetical protein J7647_32800 [Cyanobacteria bacterium SBLK]|nr:hypothetical protein [Cyanobacteria bacterium SBLK]